MSTITLCMIVKDEEKMLKECLESIYQIADEIIIVDTGSADKTIEIAQKYTQNTKHFTWIEDFSAARNYCDSFATMDYILRWDADWVLREGSMKKLLQLKQTNLEDVDIVRFMWNVEINAQRETLRNQLHYFIYRRGMFHWESTIHEHIEPNLPQQFKTITCSDIQVMHCKDVEDKQYRFTQTKTILKKELDKKPNNSDLTSYYAQGLEFDHKYEEAIVHYRKALGGLLKNDQKTISFIVERLCFCYLSVGQVEQALGLCVDLEGDLRDYKRFQLIYGDVLLASKNPDALGWYERYIANQYELAVDTMNYATDSFEIHPLKMIMENMDYTADRFEIHPLKMIVELYRQKKYYIQAISVIDILLKKVTDPIQVKKYQILRRVLKVQSFLTIKRN